MGMETELVLLAALIIIFIASFCGLLQKIRRTYENDQALTARVATNESSPRISLTEIYINPAFTSGAGSNENSAESQGVFPSTPPPYTEIYCEPPPKYEDIIKNEHSPSTQVSVSTSSTAP